MKPLGTPVRVCQVVSLFKNWDQGIRDFFVPGTLNKNKNVGETKRGVGASHTQNQIKRSDSAIVLEGRAIAQKPAKGSTHSKWAHDGGL